MEKINNLCVNSGPTHPSDSMFLPKVPIGKVGN